MKSNQYDAVIVGAGLAGLSLARHLILTTDKRILLVEKNAVVPKTTQKVGESLVQVGGYYFAKVLDMEEHLLHEHFMKYNLRFYFKTAEKENDELEDFGQSYIRNFSNVPCYQLDRNIFEAELLRLNSLNPRFQLVTSVKELSVNLAENESSDQTTKLHRIEFMRGGEKQSVQSTWVIDTTGRNRLLSRDLELREPSPIQHGASFMWVDGLVDIEKLTSRSSKETRLNPSRKSTGHLPHWLATNHFMFEGGWLWVIPLRGKTSIGVVYDQNVMNHRDVSSEEKLIDWICKTFPLFDRDLPNRDVIDFGAFRDFAYGCKETISDQRWAISGEASRFHDPLYSPGSDFIAIHNTLIVDAIQTESQKELKRKCWLYEATTRALYDSLIPTYVSSYDTLGDQEVFTLKYTWELSVYFSFFVFPFLSDLHTDTAFVPAYLSRFSKLGPINHSLHRFINDYYHWKQENIDASTSPVFHDFTDLLPLKKAERTFYHVGVSPTEAKAELDKQLDNLTELARFTITYVYAMVLRDRRALTNRAMVESIDFRNLSFNPTEIRAAWQSSKDQPDVYDWRLDPTAMNRFSPFSTKPDNTGLPAQLTGV